MLKTLDEILVKLPSMLDEDRWDSLIVNRRKPATYRVFTQENNIRICLHKFDTCNLDESFEHPHPWPGAFCILEGSYEMKIGKSLTRYSPPDEVATFVLNKGSKYSITSPLTWHSVTPLEITYTVMVNGEPFTPEVAHTKVRTTKGKDLDKMPPEELKAHLEKFKELLNV